MPAGVKTEVRTYQMYINGEWVDSKSGETFPVYDPSTEEVIAQVPDANAEDVDSPDVPGAAVALLVVHPEHHSAVGRHDDVFGLEARILVAREPAAPEGNHSLLPADPLPVRCRRRVFEDGVVGQPLRQRVRVVAVERLIESIDDIAGGRRLPRGLLISNHRFRH